MHRKVLFEEGDKPMEKAKTQLIYPNLKKTHGYHQ
jgi:hypothetical protein